MGLDVVGPLGRSGQILVSDERTNGTVILLVCQEYKGGTGAVFIRPEVKRPPQPGGFPWPTEESSKLRTAADMLPKSLRRPFLLTIDTSGMPPGPQAFRTEVLVERVFDMASDGIEKVELDFENAREWGWLGTAEDDLIESME